MWKDTPESVVTQTRPDLNSSTVASQARPRSGGLGAWLRALRPEQWLKNGFVLSPLVFSGRALIWDAQWRALVATAAFCAVASAVYLMNDVVDRDADQLHPRKSSRPIAAGLISSRSALIAALLLAVAGLAMGAATGAGVAGILAAYLGLNVLYGFWLKNVVIVDVFAIASFFIMR